MLIGIISDTHGLLRPEALQALRGSAMIIHAGDVGKPAVLEHLRGLAPVIAVRGNIDRQPWARCLPESALLRANGHTIFVLHELSQFAVETAPAGLAVVVLGTHTSPRSLSGAASSISIPAAPVHAAFACRLRWRTCMRRELRCGPSSCHCRYHSQIE
jgi:hypothetical protein